MPPFSSRPLRSSSSRNPLSNFLPSIRRKPFLLFGLPFTFTILSAAYGLSYLTQTRYEYNATKVQSVSKEEELGMKKGRRRIDLREEYWKLSRAREDMMLDADEPLAAASGSGSGSGGSSARRGTGRSGGGVDEWDEWEPKRVPRPQGVEEWGDAGGSALGASYVEQSDSTRDYQRRNKDKNVSNSASSSFPGLASLRAEGQEVTYDLSKASAPDARGNRTIVTESGKKIVIGPDGKPCKACNTRLALREAMRGAGSGAGKSSSSAASSSASPAGFFGGAMAAATSPSSTSSASTLSCPPDVEELGRSSWDLLHSIAATYPEKPSEAEQSALLSLLKALPILYPCRHCAQALQEDYTRRDSVTTASPPSADDMKVSEAVISKSQAMRFTCSIHNEVNERLGKPKWDCEDLRKLKERWEDGGQKCL
ncbi:hypothetical protein BCV69DRAFT_281235 [Microstroma glucosiphilum]|uniref:Sulfhydryl oxidase n=1 Tax=Pseudomicrostroma glucosiphilum TaxID=1684307 RepID=A0A316UGE6_9BASI|nr:hypothetical protein BCV69DRAFT_281235 [Pseudomicrostroma glucosiphilum]PWN22225.1 hypothetical protein BCV69DRAFT_281235 [Pseudomicrostroma glucosiphilum]